MIGLTVTPQRQLEPILQTPRAAILCNTSFTKKKKKRAYTTSGVKLSPIRIGSVFAKYISLQHSKKLGTPTNRMLGTQECLVHGYISTILSKETGIFLNALMSL